MTDLELPDLKTLHHTRWCSLLMKNSQGYGWCRESLPASWRRWFWQAWRICEVRWFISRSISSASLEWSDVKSDAFDTWERSTWHNLCFKLGHFQHLFLYSCLSIINLISLDAYSFFSLYIYFYLSLHFWLGTQVRERLWGLYGSI